MIENVYFGNQLSPATVALKFTLCGTSCLRGEKAGSVFLPASHSVEVLQTKITKHPKKNF
jgi:hypothetical protein